MAGKWNLIRLCSEICLSTLCYADFGQRLAWFLILFCFTASCWRHLFHFRLLHYTFILSFKGSKSLPVSFSIHYARHHLINTSCSVNFCFTVYTEQPLKWAGQPFTEFTELLLSTTAACQPLSELMRPRCLIFSLMLISSSHRLHILPCHVDCQY